MFQLLAAIALTFVVSLPGYAQVKPFPTGFRQQDASIIRAGWCRVLYRFAVDTAPASRHMRA